MDGTRFALHPSGPAPQPAMWWAGQGHTLRWPQPLQAVDQRTCTACAAAASHVAHAVVHAITASSATKEQEACWAEPHSKLAASLSTGTPYCRCTASLEQSSPKYPCSAITCFSNLVPSACALTCACACSRGYVQLCPRRRWLLGCRCAPLSGGPDLVAVAGARVVLGRHAHAAVGAVHGAAVLADAQRVLARVGVVPVHPQVPPACPQTDTALNAVNMGTAPGKLKKMSNSSQDICAYSHG